MSKAYTVEEFADQLDSDLSWRIKEISDIKVAARKSDSRSESVLLRATITILYAHWEGHVKFCANKYFEHITLRKIRYKDLEHQYYVNRFLVRLGNFYNRRESIRDRCEIVDLILRSQDERFSRIDASLIDTRSNLNTEAICDICRVCAVDDTYFSTREDFIDKILLKRRNSIAHGESAFIFREELDDLTTEGVSLMRAFKDLLQNKVYTKSYHTKT